MSTYCNYCDRDPNEVVEMGQVNGVNCCRDCYGDDAHEDDGNIGEWKELEVLD